MPLLRGMSAEAIPPGDVVWVDERNGRAPRLIRRRRGEPVAELPHDQWIYAPAFSRAAVWGGVGAAREAVGLERANVLLRPCVVAAGEVPLAVPIRFVAAFTQDRAPGREVGFERAGARHQATGLLAVEACEQHRSCGAAVVGRCVMACEVDAAPAQSRQVRHQARGDRVVLEPLRRAQLVDENHEDVRRAVGARHVNAGRCRVFLAREPLTDGRAARGHGAASDKPALDRASARESLGGAHARSIT